ncbi:hypothetical protein E0F88_33515 [Dyadobacter psychrotolerans]|uniref:Transposase n=2 Tax=Dyadobacter psychrotolerans TaxID=2541721 RepID=A0A4R5D2B7_9BACT|nr:hypothetical protein E0F88_33515 [Dyadobacter psychrotolerans]
MNVNDLQRNKKSRRSVLFKRKVVEIYRAELSSQFEIQQSLHISQTELRQMNRWYFKHRLRPYFSLSFYNRTTMKKKTDASYLKALEKRLLEAEKENKFLRLKAEAYEIVIQIAEEEFKIPILKKPGAQQPKN